MSSSQPPLDYGRGDFNPAYNRIVLEAYFKMPSSRTLKTSLKPHISDHEAISVAATYLNEPDHVRLYDRIEFKSNQGFGNIYIVVARLKDKEKDQ